TSTRASSMPSRCSCSRNSSRSSRKPSTAAARRAWWPSRSCSRTAEAGAMLTLVLVVILVALTFEYINGFHDTADSIATVVATKVLSPMQAVGLAAGMNLVGALAGTAVAKTIASGLIDAGVVEVGSQLILCALLGGITWNLITWWFGLPSSSSHALIGGLI